MALKTIRIMFIKVSKLILNSKNMFAVLHWLLLVIYFILGFKAVWRFFGHDGLPLAPNIPLPYQHRHFSVTTHFFELLNIITTCHQNREQNRYMFVYYPRYCLYMEENDILVVTETVAGSQAV